MSSTHQPKVKSTQQLRMQNQGLVKSGLLY